MTEPRKQSREEAEDVLRQYAESEGDRLRQFTAGLAQAGGAEPDYTRESLRAAGALVRDRLRPPPGGPATPFSHLGDEGRELLDGLTAYFAACLRRRHPELRWQLDTDPKSSFYHRPILAGVPGFELYPQTPVATKLLAAWSQHPPDDDWLVQLFDRWEERLPSDPTQDPSALPIDDVEIVAVEDDPSWDAEIWIPEYAEQVLGEVAFQRLPDRLEEVSGIEGLAWEDRERFLAKLGKDVDLGDLRDAVAAVLRDARAEGRGTA